MSKLVKVAGWAGHAKAHVIFVHGLGGDGYDTWRHNGKAELFWPLWIAEDNEHVSSWTFSYEAPPVNWLGTSMSLHERATNFLAQLLSEKELSQGNILFVCHSLGGLIVKQMLREADSQSAHSAAAETLIKRIKGIMFLATPHTGAVLATLADKLRFLIWPSNATVDIVKNSPALRDLNLWFRNSHSEIKTEIIYETIGSSIGTVVDPTSSDAGLPNVIPVPDDSDHIQISKPQSRESLVYRKTDALLKSCVLDRTITPNDDSSKLVLPDLPSLPSTQSVLSVSKFIRLSIVTLIILTGAWTYNFIVQPFAKNPAQEWVEISSKARKKGTITHTSTIPAEVSASRLRFENWWNETPLTKKRELSPKILFDALSFNNRIYRVSEKQSESKPNANHWADEAIEYFENIQDRYFLAESLLDKAAIFLELSQIEHTEPDSFDQIAKNGDKIMSRAFSLAADDQKSSAMRIWSRFYYNLARPQGGKLHDDWSNDYLSIAYTKMSEAYDLEPGEPKNASQLARVAQRLGANPPQDHQAKWTATLRDVQSKLLRSWEEQKDKLKTPEQRIPNLNVLATMTMDVVGREWRAITPKTASGAQSLLKEINDVALPAQREVMATIGQTEWEEDYDFDVHYDLGRIRSLETQLLLSFDEFEANKIFEEALKNMRTAAQKASAIQASSAFFSVDSNPNMSGLPPAYRDKLKAIFEIK